MKTRNAFLFMLIYPFLKVIYLFLGCDTRRCCVFELLQNASLFYEDFPELKRFCDRSVKEREKAHPEDMKAIARFSFRKRRDAGKGDERGNEP